MLAQTISTHAKYQQERSIRDILLMLIDAKEVLYSSETINIKYYLHKDDVYWSNLSVIKSYFQILCSLANKKCIGIRFDGLEKLKVDHNDCNHLMLSCRRRASARNELYQLLMAIKSQTKSYSGSHERIIFEIV